MGDSPLNLKCKLFCFTENRMNILPVFGRRADVAGSLDGLHVQGNRVKSKSCEWKVFLAALTVSE